MKKTGNLIVLILLGFIPLLPSCESAMEEWLEEPSPEGFKSSDDAFFSVSEMDVMMNGAYATALGFNGNGLGSAAVLIPEWSGDFVAPYEPNHSEIGGWGEYYKRKHSTQNWNDHTRVLQYCSNAENISNRVIAELEGDEHRDDPNYDVMGKRMLGEAYAMRAVINFEYTRFFGLQYSDGTYAKDTRDEKAWLYRKTFVNSLESAEKKRETVGDSYAFMLADCDRAIELLPEEYDPAVNDARYATNRFNKDFAKALKAQIYWQMNEYDECRAIIDELIGPAPGNPVNYPLAEVADVSDPWSGYPGQVYWRMETEWYGRSRGLEVIFAWEGNCGTHPTRQDKNVRWRWFVPEGDTRSRSDMNQTGYGRFTLSDWFIEYADFDTVNDVRYTMLIDRLDAQEEGPYQGKYYYWPLKHTVVGATGNNVLWFRSGTFLLMRAEINARAGNDAAAIADLDAIRERAGLVPYGEEDPANLMPTLLEEIFRERARECYLERDRLWDILRRGVIDGTMMGHGDRLDKPGESPGIDVAFSGPDPIPWDSPIWRYPLPTRETLWNPAALE